MKINVEDKVTLSHKFHCHIAITIILVCLKSYYQKEEKKNEKKRPGQDLNPQLKRIQAITRKKSEKKVTRARFEPTKDGHSTN